jgi:hypothetical protein
VAMSARAKLLERVQKPRRPQPLPPTASASLS